MFDIVQVVIAKYKNKHIKITIIKGARFTITISGEIALNRQD